MVYPDSLCAQVLKAKHFPLGNLLDTVVAGTASPTWRAIEYGLAAEKRGCLEGGRWLIDQDLAG